MPQETEPDPYELLGLGRDATPGDVQQAYRRAAQAAHPDHLPSDPGATDRFAALATAYAMLRDPRRRAAYDRAHPQLTVSHSTPSPRASGSAIRPAWSQAPAAPGRRPALWAGPVHITPPDRR
jgi:curved DNA-binding protein CbpA